MRFVLDTNTAISGLIWTGGPSAALIDAAREGRIQLISNAALLAELHGVIQRTKFYKKLVDRQLNAMDLFAGYAAMVIVAPAIPIDPVIIKDPADDQVLAAALSGSADFIVSGDQHVTDFNDFEGIPIVSAATALTLINQTDQHPTSAA